MSAMTTAQICALIAVAVALLVAAYVAGLTIGRRQQDAQQQAQQATIHLLTKALFDTSDERDWWQQLAERRGDEALLGRIHERTFEDDREIQP